MRKCAKFCFVGLFILIYYQLCAAEDKEQVPIRYGVQIGAFLYTGIQDLLPIAQDVARDFRCVVGIWNLGSWYKVIAGEYESKKAAERLMRRLRSRFPTAFVTVLPPLEDRISVVKPD